jgi:predicted Zn finger-like uncharacterized protein
MIIECPACRTKYNQDLPPEGRMVRCAKCRTVWRAMPQAANEPAAVAGGGEPNASDTADSNAHASYGTPSGWDWNGRIAPAAQTSDDSDTFDEPGLSGREKELPAGSELSQRPALTAGFTNDEIAGRRAQGEGADEDQERADSRDAGKLRWFPFRRKNDTKPNSGGEAGLDPPAAAPAAETIPFLRSSSAAAYNSQEGSDLNSLDEARAAVRNVFGTLGDQRAAGRAFSVPVVPQAEREQFSVREMEPGAHGPIEDESTGNEWLNARQSAAAAPIDTHGESWEPDVSGEGDFEAEPEQSSLNGGDRPEEEAPSQRMKGWQAALATEEDDQDAQIRSALRARFPAHDQQGGETHTAALQYGQQNLTEELERSESGEDEPAWGPPPAMLRNRPDSQPPDPEDAYSEISEGDGSFDPRLFREIAETREQASRRRHGNRGGGLALAAAWGLFLCIAGGLVVGFVRFPDIAAGALPGLAPLYRALGMPVTDQPLIFEGVQYEWTTPENKPALNIKGAVYNRAQREVQVPDFVITIKDGDPAFDREYSAKLQVNGSKIRPEQRAEFEIELMSPSPSITAVELELRSVR